MTKTFKVPFATQGDRTSIPNEVQADGAVSYTQGYGYDYERDQVSDPAAKDIEREKMNGIFHDITEAVGEIQNYGFPKWAEEGKPYPIRAIVYHKNKVWQSKVENNEVEPVAGAQWVELKADLAAGDINVYTKTESDQRFQPLGNYLPAGYSYSKAESDTKYQPKGNYAPAGNYALKGESYTKSEGDTRYQAKGSYQPSGDYATNDTVNSKFNAANSAAINANNNANSRVPSSLKINSKPLTTDITLGANDVNAVPANRRVNSKPLDNDITLSAGDVKAIPVDIVGTISNGGSMASANKAGWWKITADDTSTVSDFPKLPNGANLYGYGFMFVGNYNGTWFQHYYSHNGVNAKRQGWSQNITGNWDIEYNTAYKPSSADVGAYTKAEVDSRISTASNGAVMNIRRGAAVNPPKQNEYGPKESPAGCVVTGVMHDNSTSYGLYFTYRPLQIYVNGSWKTLAGDA